MNIAIANPIAVNMLIAVMVSIELSGKLFSQLFFDLSN